MLIFNIIIIMCLSLINTYNITQSITINFIDIKMLSSLIDDEVNNINLWVNITFVKCLTLTLWLVVNNFEMASNKFYEKISHHYNSYFLWT